MAIFNIKKQNNSIFEYIFTIIIIIGAVSMIVPFVWMILASLKTSVEFYETSILPKEYHWENYSRFFTDKNLNFPLYFYNTVKVTVLSIIGTLISCSLTGFALARLRFPGKNFLFGYVLVSMFMPAQVTLIPLFIIMKTIGWYDSHLALIAPYFVGNAFGIFLLRQFFMGIPRDLEDAAKIDGCNWLVIFYRIYLPLTKPALITLAIITLQGAWGQLLRPLIFLSDKKLFTLVLGIKTITDNQYTPQPQLVMAGYTLLILPVFIVYIFAQRYFVEGISNTGLKG